MSVSDNVISSFISRRWSFEVCDPIRTNLECLVLECPDCQPLIMTLSRLAEVEYPVTWGAVSVTQEMELLTGETYKDKRLEFSNDWYTGI